MKAQVAVDRHGCGFMWLDRKSCVFIPIRLGSGARNLYLNFGIIDKYFCTMIKAWMEIKKKNTEYKIGMYLKVSSYIYIHLLFILCLYP